VRAFAVFPAARRLQVVDHPAPALRTPTEVEVRVLQVGVCGTDKEICAFQYGTPPAGSDYLVLGHESLGEVVGTGSGVSHLAPGDLVVPMVRRPCPDASCAACRAGRQDFCVSGGFTERGIKAAHGFMAERVVDEERYMVPVPAGLRAVAVLTEPLTIAEKALGQVRDVQDRLPPACRHAPEAGGSRHRAVVLGAGPVGLLGAMALRAAGYEVFVYSRSAPGEGRAAVAAAIGATYVPAETHALGQLAEQVGNVDLVYEAVGASALAFEALKFLGTNGIFVFTGVPGRKAPVRLDTDRIMRRLVLENQVVLGTVNAGREAYEAAIRDLGTFSQRWPEALRAVITGRFPLDQAAAPLTGQVSGIKNVVEVAGPA
jgi:threonine dehydrogenase-like Zn-dependent dehydrogenase